MPLAITHTLAALALVATTASAWAAGAADPAHFRLTPALLDRMEAAAAELRKLPQAPGSSGDEDDDADAESVEDLARKLDAHPQVRAALARQGLTSREYATATLAALHAGMALAVEKAPGAQPAPGFTPEQRANVEVMRARRKGRP
ncbi:MULTISPECIES: hypothetical protein [unclassified Acidovorax]|uniref:hypothetical protein n=1 Tax=unclassified Acidovorax TaxID=2684926 RepID=UPI001C43A088|nr:MULTISPECIES: hypothetical protein [unclassified Acidovorax]MBV7426946.1 hypothetical protein [Acidovorax sp. sif0732]MBV7448071.1 hypothetical protein [Acidovorax sp. sif0715]